MKLLILSQTAWRNDNSFGSSYTGIFGGMDDVEFANIYCRAGLPQNDICKHHFYISEKAMVKNLLNKRVPTGRVMEIAASQDTLHREPEMYARARKLRWQVLYWARDLLWRVGRWKSQELIDFIDSFDADILFFPLYYSNYTNRIAKFIIEHTKKKLIVYISDDVYTMRQFSLSPLYWINRFMVRPKIRRVMTHCQLLYVISDVQKKAYEKVFGKQTKVLTKGADFSKPPKITEPQGDVIKILFTGNIGSGRWQVLGNIASALKNINQAKMRAVLDIYTLTPLTKRMKKALNVPGSATVHGAVSSAKVKQLQAEADILVHTESFALKERLKVYQSFSTKIVDYAHMAKCIFAAGPAEVASIRHLAQNDAAVVATSQAEIAEKLERLVENPKMIAEYAGKAWACGERNYQIDAIQNMVKADIFRVAGKTEKTKPKSNE